MGCVLVKGKDNHWHTLSLEHEITNLYKVLGDIETDGCLSPSVLDYLIETYPQIIECLHDNYKLWEFVINKIKEYELIERGGKSKMSKFEVGEKVRFLKDHSVRQIVEINGGYYRFVGDPTFYPELYLQKLKEDEENMRRFKFEVGDRVWFMCNGWYVGPATITAREYAYDMYPVYQCDKGEGGYWYEDGHFLKSTGQTDCKKRRPHPKKMLDDLGIEKVILSEKRGKAVTYVELKDGRKGKATQDIKDTPDPYVGIAIATLSAMTGSKVNFRNMVDFLVKKGQYLRK